MRRNPKVVVIGAGAFGGWTALYLLWRGARVTLLDAWGPGNSRASSGGETRTIRAAYGANQSYTRTAARALQLWKEHERRWKTKLLHQTGVLWLVEGDEHFERESLPVLREAGIAHEELSALDLEKRWPQINLDGVQWGLYEPNGGYLTARLACQQVRDGFIAQGGEYRQLAVVSGDLDGKWEGLKLSDGSMLHADHYVFACGPWLGNLFPETIGSRIRPTRQEIFFFGTPAGDERFSEARLPAWGDHGERFMYGVPGNQERGFKVADDTRGKELDPTSSERVASVEGLKAVREYLGFRFPAMKGAPLLESRVCQYENSPDENFIIDCHPQRQDVWLVGGGSGHGFKHGPAIGEMVAALVMDDKEAERGYLLSRLGKWDVNQGDAKEIDVAVRYE